MACMERRLKGGRKEGRQGKCPRQAPRVSTNAAALPCECHRVRVLYVKAPRYQQLARCTSSPMRYQGGEKGREDGRGERPPYATQRNAGGREGGKQRKAGECGTRRVGPYAAAPNTDNAGCGGNQRRQASASGQRGQAAASGSEQWWQRQARRRGSGGGAGGSNGSGSGVHSVISSNSVSFIGVTSLIPKTSIHSSVQSVMQSVRQSSPAPAPNVVMSRKSLPASVMMMMTTMPNPRRQQQQRWRSQRSSGGGGGSSSQ